MPFSPLDALLQVSKPLRPAAAAPRNEGPTPFEPALKQAYQAEQPSSTVSAPTSPPKRETDSPSTAGKERDSSQGRADEAAAVPAESDSEVPVEAEAEENAEQEDEIEISETAAAAAALAAQVKPTETEQAAVLTEAESAAIQADADASDSAEAPQQHGAEIETTSAAQDTEGAIDPTAQASEVEAAEQTDVKVSTLHSARNQHDERDQKNQQATAELEVSQEKSEEAARAESSLEETAIASDSMDGTGDGTLHEDSDDSREKQINKGESDGKASDNPAVAPKPETVASVDGMAVASGDSIRSEAPSADATVAAPPVDAAAPTDSASRTTGVLDRLMAGRGLKANKEPGEPGEMPTVDRARFVQRVEGAMKAAHQRDGKIQVRLSPPDLGSVKIELALQNGVLSAKLEAETPAARNLLLDSLPALRERLAQQDIRVEKFDVDVRRDGGNSADAHADGRPADQSGERESGRRATTAGKTASPASPVLRSVTGGSSTTASGLDVRV